MDTREEEKIRETRNYKKEKRTEPKNGRKKDLREYFQKIKEIVDK